MKMTMKRRHKYRVSFTIHYISGKEWNGSTEVTALSEEGARAIVRWLYSKRDLTINSVYPLECVGGPIYPDYGVLGDW